LTLILALSYGGRTEIVEAVRSMAQKVKDGHLEPAEINEQVVSQHLYTCHYPDPDLLIRTSGEMRISNFLLWQISYAELVVTPTLWPDFRKPQFLRRWKNTPGATGGLDWSKAPMPEPSHSTAAPLSKAAIFFRRLFSFVVLWTVVIGALFSGHKALSDYVFLLIILLLAVSGLLEFYGMVQSSITPATPNGACAAAS
jgi:hypothetical protein